MTVLYLLIILFRPKSLGVVNDFYGKITVLANDGVYMATKAKFEQSELASKKSW